MQCYKFRLSPRKKKDTLVWDLVMTPYQLQTIMKKYNGFELSDIKGFRPKTIVSGVKTMTNRPKGSKK